MKNKFEYIYICILRLKVSKFSWDNEYKEGKVKHQFLKHKDILEDKGNIVNKILSEEVRNKAIQMATFRNTEIHRHLPLYPKGNMVEKLNTNKN